MSGGEIMTVVGFFVMLFGFLFGLWRYIEAKILAVRTESSSQASAATALAALAREELAAHKLHTAETYITKQGLRETTDQIMGAIGGVKAAVENMTLRVDRIVENQAKPRTAARS
jgi:capsule polysaccharide export protein KpsE/RkpR